MESEEVRIPLSDAEREFLLWTERAMLAATVQIEQRLLDLKEVRERFIASIVKGAGYQGRFEPDEFCQFLARKEPS